LSAAGAEVRLAMAPELAPLSAIESNPAWAENHAATLEVPEATPADVEWADVVLFGSPTRFGNVSAQLKQFMDTLGGLWAEGRLADKVYSGFVSSATAHGGQETTLQALYTSVHHFGGIVVAPGFTDPIKFDDGNPYGTSHVDGPGQPGRRGDPRLDQAPDDPCRRDRPPPQGRPGSLIGSAPASKATTNRRSRPWPSSSSR